MVPNWNSTAPLAYWTTTTAANTASFVVNQPSLVSVTPATPAPKSPLDWLREQVEEVCQLARAA